MMKTERVPKNLLLQAHQSIYIISVLFSLHDELVCSSILGIISPKSGRTFQQNLLFSSWFLPDIFHIAKITTHTHFQQTPHLPHVFCPTKKISRGYWENEFQPNHHCEWVVPYIRQTTTNQTPSNCVNAEFAGLSGKWVKPGVFQGREITGRAGVMWCLWEGERLNGVLNGGRWFEMAGRWKDWTFILLICTTSAPQKIAHPEGLT